MQRVGSVSYTHLTRHEAELGDEGPSTLTRKLGVKNAPAEKPQKAPRKKATPKPTPTSANDNKDGYQLPSEALLVRGDGRTAGASDAEPVSYTHLLCIQCVLWALSRVKR